MNCIGIVKNESISENNTKLTSQMISQQTLYREEDCSVTKKDSEGRRNNE